MVKQILLSMLLAATAAFAGFYFETSGPTAGMAILDTAIECSGDSVDFAIRKRELLKEFKTCVDKYTSYTISVLWFKVKEGEYGMEEQEQCFKAYANSLDALASCAEIRLNEKPLFSLEERIAYQYYFKLFGNLIQYMKDFREVQESWEGLSPIDPFDIEDEKAALTSISYDKFEMAVAEAEGSREDKDLLILYYRFLRSKYDWQYRCNIKPAFLCDVTWLDEEKAEFLKKYPESQYREFVETQMPGFDNATEEEKKRAEEEEKKIAQKDREHAIEEVKAANDVWLALSGMAMFGFPSTYTPGFDNNFDVTNMLTFGLKASWRSVVFQYQYFLSFGDNNKGGSVSEKGYSLLGGLMIGPKKIFTLDVLFGLSYIDTYPLDEDMRAANLDDESWTLAFQGTYYIPISDRLDITAHLQARVMFVENYCRDSYWEENSYGYYDCWDPLYPADDKYWDGLQWTFSAGIGIRFWKPRY